MTQVKHTPGPWNRGFAGHGGKYIGTEDEVVAQVARGPRWEVNTRLIEAAPELLEALQMAVQYWEWSIRDGTAGATEIEDFAYASAVIAKAEGK